MRLIFSHPRSPGEGNGHPLQYSCLENLLDSGAWRATVCGVANSWTRLSNIDFTFSQSPYRRSLMQVISDIGPVSVDRFFSSRNSHKWNPRAWKPISKPVFLTVLFTDRLLWVRNSSIRGPEPNSVHNLEGPHSPPHDSARNRKRNFARTIARPAALRSGVNWVPGHFRKGWQLLQRQALSGTLDRKAAILAGE
ncbi:hypothetical protein MG293_001391 [Ovis ammon polii]|uniref:Uncharacterized protein n=1 Tax=Ovis ammon polii TaxID=230172 RepID=A0AAD4UPH7_OVIAM|nr:hypothetical protein MG293_001391 [Ovis ammon polii]